MNVRNESLPFWPGGPTPPEGSPNVLIVLFDDVGFSDFGCLEHMGSRRAPPTVLRFAVFSKSGFCFFKNRESGFPDFRISGAYGEPAAAADRFAFCRFPTAFLNPGLIFLKNV